MHKHLLLLLLFFIGLGISAVEPHDYFTWLLEVFPAILGMLILVFTFKKFQFSFFTYVFILIHCYILFVGGHYTYAQVPLFDWIKDYFEQVRNNYDKVGHFAQGFVPALIARELYIRQAVIKKGFWLPFLTVCTCMSLSVVYEFLEWFVAILSGQSAEAFLGTQGYIWDTQSDMLYATVGALCMVLLFSKMHNKKIAQLM